MSEEKKIAPLSDDELGKVAGRMRARALPGAHLVHVHAVAAGKQLQGGFAPGKSSPDDGDAALCHSPPPSPPVG